MKLRLLGALALAACLLRPVAAQAADSCVQETYAGSSEEIIQRKAANCMDFAAKHVRDIGAYNASVATTWGSRVPALNDVKKAAVDMENFRLQFSLKKNELRKYISGEGAVREPEAVARIQAEAAEVKGLYLLAQADYEKSVTRAIPLWARQLAINMLEQELSNAELNKQEQLNSRIREKMDDLVGDLPSMR